jgi:hypothetical protein
VSVAGEHPLSGQKTNLLEVQTSLTLSVGRALSHFESDVLNYPRLCAVCFNGTQVTPNAHAFTAYN